MPVAPPPCCSAQRVARPRAAARRPDPPGGDHAVGARRQLQQHLLLCVANAGVGIGIGASVGIGVGAGVAGGVAGRCGVEAQLRRLPELAAGTRHDEQADRSIGRELERQRSALKGQRPLRLVLWHGAIWH